MPIWLDAADCADSPMAGRLVFVVDLDGHSTNEVVNALKTVPGAVIPGDSEAFLDDGLGLIIGNYLSGQEVGGGVFALAEPRPFLLAVRALADAVYSAALRRGGGQFIVDASPHAVSRYWLTAIFPDALVVEVGAESSEDPAALAALVAAKLGALPAASPPVTTDRHPREGELIFVVGCPRSGTTWLENLLAAHPAIGGPGRETAIFASIHPLWSWDGVGTWIDRDALRAAMRQFCDALFAECLTTKAPSATWLIEKTPIHGLHLEVIAALYPDAWVVSIIRDGRDVARSLYELSFGFDDVGAAARSWTVVTSEIERMGPSCPRFRHLRYEDLLEAPTTHVGELLQWVGLPFDDNTERDIAAQVTTRVSRYNTSGDVGAGKWKDMPAADLRTIYRYAGDRLVETGYMTADALAAARRQLAYRVDTLRATLASRLARRTRER